MNKKRALRLARKWALGHVCTLRDEEAAEYHSMFAAMLEESMSNEPLTLEQLRQMEGQWIIIKAFDAEISGIMPAFIKDQFATTLCELGSKAIIPDLCEAHFSFNEYGKTWIAYDRPPEGEEDTHEVS